MTNYTFRQLEIFMTAATYGSFSTAAKFLYLSKATITKQIKLLETQLDFKLFKKHGRFMRLTPEARQIIPQVKLILNESQKLKSMIDLGLDRHKPILRFSIGHTFASPIFNAMNQFKRIFEVEYDISIDRPEQQYKKVESCKADFLIGSDKKKGNSLIYYPFLNVRFFLVASKKNPLIPEGKFTLKDLKDLVFIHIKPDHFRQGLETKFELIKQNFRRIIQLETYHAISEAIRSDFGIGILPATMLSQETRDFRVLPINQLSFKRQIYLVSNSEQKDIKEQFINYIQTDFKLQLLQKN